MPPQVCAAGGGAGPAGGGQVGAGGGEVPAAAVIQGAAAAGERGAGGQIRAVQHGARLGRGADQDMLDKARRIKDQDIEMKTLENLLHEETKEMLNQLSDIDLKKKELAKE